MPTAKLDYAELKKEADKAKKSVNLTHEQASRLVRSISLAGVRAIKQRMPVDKGRARASWGMWTPADLRGGADAKASDAVFETDDDGLTITQGSNVPYIDALNAGHSRQAPAGFIDTVELKMKLELESKLGRIDPTDPNAGLLFLGVD